MQSRSSHCATSIFPSIAEKNRSNAHLTNREIQLVDWVRYSANWSVFDMYTCTKLETEPHPTQTSRPGQSPWQRAHWSDLSSRIPRSATSESNHHEESSARGSRRGTPLPSSSLDRRRGVGAHPQRPFHSEEPPRRVSLPEVLPAPLKVSHHPERIQERDPKFATPSTAMTIFHDACVPAYLVSIPLPPQLAGVLPLTAPGGHSRHRTTIFSRSLHLQPSTTLP